MEHAPSIAAAATLVLVFALERLAPWKREWKEGWRRNVPLAVFNLVVVTLLCGGCLLALSLAAGEHGLGLFRWLGVPLPIAALLSVPALDLVSWGWHRANHRLPLLWRFHAVHHSDSRFDVTTSLRFHAGELLLSLPVRAAAIVALGVPVAGLVAFEIVFAVFNQLEHGNLRLSAGLERAITGVVITPAVHRVHHSRDVRELARNFGTIFAVWDRLFATWLPAASSRDVRVGLDGVAAPRLRDMLVLPFRRTAAPPAEAAG